MEGLQPNIAADVHMDDAPHGDGDMEHDGPKDNQDDDASRLGSQNDDEMDANPGGTTVSTHANMLAVSPIKFGLLQPLENMVESPMVTFSKSVYDHIKKNLGTRKLVVSVNEVQEASAGEAPMIVASPAQSTEESAGTQLGTLSGPLPVESAQPVMHGSTSIGDLHATSIASSTGVTAMLAGASQAADLDTMGGFVPDGGEQFLASPFVTPVGVNKVFGATPSCNPSMSEVISFGGITPNSMKGYGQVLG